MSNLYTVYSTLYTEAPRPPKTARRILPKILSPFSSAFDIFHICAYSGVLAASDANAWVQLPVGHELNKLHKIIYTIAARNRKNCKIPHIRRICLIYIKRVLYGCKTRLRLREKASSPTTDAFDIYIAIAFDKGDFCGMSNT